MAPDVEDVATAALPGWVQALRVLVPITSTLVTVATNPVEWLRGSFLQLLVEYVFVRPLAWVLEYILLGFEIVADAILSTAGPLTTPARIMGDAAELVWGTLYGAVYGLAESAGLAAPIAGAFATAVLVAVLVTLLYMTVAGILDAIPGGEALTPLARWKP